MNRHFDDQGFNDSGLKTRASEFFQRNWRISFEPVEGSINALADYIGPTKSCGRPITRIPTASSSARRTWCASGWRALAFLTRRGAGMVLLPQVF
jgi:hypothetical protein